MPTAEEGCRARHGPALPAASGSQPRWSTTTPAPACRAHAPPGANRCATSCSTPRRRMPWRVLSTKNSSPMKDFLSGVTIFLIVVVAWFCGGGDGPRIPLVFRYRNLGWSGHLVLRGVAMAVSTWPRWSHRLHIASCCCTAPVIGGRTVDRRVRSARLPRPYVPARLLPAS